MCGALVVLALPQNRCHVSVKLGSVFSKAGESQPTALNVILLTCLFGVLSPEYLSSCDF